MTSQSSSSLVVAGEPRTTLVASLSELAASVQRSRTVSAVLETAGQGILKLGLRFYAFELREEDVVLRYLATARSRLDVMQAHVGRELLGLSAPLSAVPLAVDVVEGRRTIHSEALDVLHSFLRASTGFDPSPLERTPATAGISNGVLTPVFVREHMWGFLGIVSPSFTPDDASAVALFATHLGSAIDVALCIEDLERANENLAACNAELSRVQRDLVERERLAALGELAAVVAHEVRNPLCVLVNSIGALREFVRAGAPVPKFQEAEAFAAMAAEEADRLNKMVSDLLEFARPHPPELRRGSLVPVLEKVALATALDGRVRMHIASDLPSVFLDPTFVERAVVNLVLNGLQATAKDGTVRVRALREALPTGTFARVDVSDDGQGIPADVRESIFEPFFTTKACGTGLGLTVVQRIVASHGGDLSVESSGAGTTFTMRLAEADA